MTLIKDSFNSGTPFSESDRVFAENRLKFVSEKVEKLNKLCTDLDPYQPIPASALNELNEFGIFETHDPFVVTNKLVVLLEESIEELQALEDKKKALS